MTLTSNSRTVETDDFPWGGEAGARLQRADLSARLGPVADWPVSLRVPLGIALSCSFPVILWHGRDFLTFFNDAAAPMLGPRGFDALGQPGSAALAGSWRDIGPAVESVYASGAPAALDCLPLPSGGGADRRCFRFALSPIRGDSDSVEGVYASVLEFGDFAANATQSSHLAAACETSGELRARQQRLSAFLEHSTVIGFLKDAEGRYEYLSPTFERRYKVRQADWIGKTDFELWPEPIARHFTDADRAVLATGGHVEVVENAPDPGGADAWWLTNKFAFRDVMGRIHVGGLAVDITARKQAEEALAASEERRKLGAAVAGLALAEVDYRADRIRLSAEAAHLFGLGEAAMEAPRAVVHATFHPDDRAELLERIRASLDPAGPGWFDMDHRILLPDGTTRWLRARKQVIFEGNGAGRRAVHAILAAVDVTAEKSAEDAARRNEAFVREVLDSLPQQVGVLDAGGTLIAVNESWRRFARDNDGAAQHVLPPVNYLDVCRRAAAQGDESARKALDGLSSLLGGTSESFNLEYPCHSPQQARWFVMHARRAVVGRQGAIITHTDITQQKIAEDALRESEHRFRAIAEMNPDAIVVSVDGRYVYANTAAVALLGAQSVDEILALTPFDVVEAPFHDLVRRRMRAAVEGHVDPLLEYRWVKRDGAPVDVEVGTGPVTWLGKRGVQAVAREITGRKRAEAALRDADRRKDEFLATLAHELRNPLTPIANGVHVLLKTEADPGSFGSRRNLLTIMKRQVSHLVRLVDDLLEISRISRGKIEIRKEPIDCAAVVRNAIEACQPLIEARGHSLTVEFPADRLTIDVDPVRLTQVVVNLVNNAANYTAPGGRIEIAALRADDDAVIRVRDNGMGIPSDKLPNVFELFTQIGRSAGDSRSGLGIGLALVEKLVQLHGGRVEARSAGLGTGSEFLVRLPLGAELPRTRSDSTDATLHCGHLRILVIEDNEDVAASLAMLLQSYGARVEVAGSGVEGLAALEAGLPDIVFSDIGMPGMNGYETARRIRARPEWRDVLLVAVSGWGAEGDILQAREAGFDRHLTKPVDPEVLEKLLAVVAGNAD